jgi:formate/nitrite transporter FocA (FNT family)
MGNKIEIKNIHEFYSGPDWMKIAIAGPTILFMLALISAALFTSNTVAIVMGVSGGLLLFTSMFKLNAICEKFTHRVRNKNAFF